MTSFFLVSFDRCGRQLLNFSFLGSCSCRANVPRNFLSCVHVVVVGDPTSLGLHTLVEHVSLTVVIAEVQGFAIFSRKSPDVSGLFFPFISWGIDLFNGNVLKFPLSPLGWSNVQGVIQVSNLVAI